MKPQFLISAVTAGSGKTILAMGLSRALQKRGLKIQTYKAGPDFLDPQLLSLSAGCESVNLDTWMSSHTHVQHLYNKYVQNAADFASTVLCFLYGRFSRPCDLLTYTSTSAGRSPAQIAASKKHAFG